MLKSQRGADRSGRHRKTTTNKQAVGDFAEDLAAEFLQANGLNILHRNFLCKVGEIDLIASDHRYKEVSIVFVEVRYRRNQSYGGGLASITLKKQEKLRRSAQTFLLQQHSSDIPCRFDVISVSGRPKQPDIHWIENAF